MVALMVERTLDDTHGEPARAARALVAGNPSPAWLDTYMHQLSTLRSTTQLSQILEVWALSQAEFAEMMGVSRQAVGKWLDRLPSDRHVAIATLAAATDLLVHYVRRDRIPAVVRRAAPALGNRSLLDLVAAGEHDAVLLATRTMFDPAGALA